MLDKSISLSVPKSIRQFAALPALERKLLLYAILLVAVMRVILWMLPFSLVRKLNLSRQKIVPSLAALPVHRLAWAVQVAGRRIPRATCLTQALAMQRLLASAGHPAELRIGVVKDALRGFESHAWVEWQGNVVLGDQTGLQRFAPMLVLRKVES